MKNPKIGFLSHAKVFQRALDEGKVLAPAKKCRSNEANYFQ